MHEGLKGLNPPAYSLPWLEGVPLRALPAWLMRLVGGTWVAGRLGVSLGR
jgi:hypothetical protein